MLNLAQLQFLESFISAQGIYFEVIRDEENVDFGTKVLYLLRAIDQDCAMFVRSLDKLYYSFLRVNKRNKGLEFIRALKIINDLYYNNEVKFDEYGVRVALEHYFGALGPINEESFQLKINELVHNRVDELCVNRKEEVCQQIINREIIEDSCAIHIGWRKKLDLPSTQREYYILDVSMLNLELRILVLNNLLAFEVLMVTHHIPFVDIISIEESICTLVLKSYKEVSVLLSSIGISFKKLIEFDENTLTILFDNHFEISRLVKYSNVELKYILSLNVDMQEYIFERHYEIELYYNNINVKLSEILSLNEFERNYVLKNAKIIIKTLNKKQLTFADIATMTQNELVILFPISSHPQPESPTNSQSSSKFQKMFMPGFKIFIAGASYIPKAIYNSSSKILGSPRHRSQPRLLDA